MENATTLAVEATKNANNSANHPPYVGEDLYWYVWNNETKSYDKTDKYSKGDGFSIKMTFASISEMEAYDNSSVVLELGDFVLISSDVEDEDNSKLYVVTSVTSSKITFGFLTDMSGARGFTGHTPQLSVGTITTGAAGTLANVSLTENGTDTDGNPKYLINFVIPKGDKGDKGDKGEAPKIQDGTWWLYNNSTGLYENTGVVVSSDYELTKTKVENVLTGNISSHTHDQYLQLSNIKTATSAEVKALTSEYDFESQSLNS